MNNNIFSDALWWLRSRDKGALIFVGILAALLLVLLIYAFARGGSNGNDDSAGFVVTESTPAPLPTAVPLATVPPAPTIAVPTAIPTAVPTPELTTDDLVAGTDNAEQVASGTDGTATGDTATGDTATGDAATGDTTTVSPTATPVPAPANTPVPAPAAPTATPTPEATETPTGPPTPTPTPCVVGSGGFCIRPGTAPATAVTPTATPLPTTPTPEVTPAPEEVPNGSITSTCGNDGSITITFKVTNPESATEAISVQPLLTSGQTPPAFVVPIGDSIDSVVTLEPGYLVGDASLFVNQVPISTVALDDCSAPTP